MDGWVRMGFGVGVEKGVLVIVIKKRVGEAGEEGGGDGVS